MTKKKLEYKKGDILINKDGKRVMFVIDAGVYFTGLTYETLEFIAKGEKIETVPDEMYDGEIEEQGFRRVGTVMDIYVAIGRKPGVSKEEHDKMFAEKHEKQK